MYIFVTTLEADATRVVLPRTRVHVYIVYIYISYIYIYIYIHTYIHTYIHIIHDTYIYIHHMYIHIRIYTCIRRMSRATILDHKDHNACIYSTYTLIVLLTRLCYNISIVSIYIVCILYYMNECMMYIYIYIEIYMYVYMYNVRMYVCIYIYIYIYI